MSGSGSGRTDRLAILLIAISSAVLAVWVVAAVLMSNHGFDLTDEGYYVLSYRWWHSTPRAVSGVQYIYGPLFQLFGYDVRALRIIRLVSIVGTHAVFAWAFITWLRTTEQGASLSRAWCWAWGIAIVASGGISYGRLPLSPGYNDLSLLASLLLVAAVLRMLVGVRRREALPVGPALALPPLVVVLLLSKWAAGIVVLGFVALLAAGALRAAGPRWSLTGRSRFLVAAAGSAALSVIGADVAMGGFASAIPPMLRVNRLVAARTNSPTQLLAMYASTGLELLLLVVLLGCAPALLLGAAWRLSRLGARRAARLAALWAPASIVLVAVLYLPGDGLRADVARYMSCLLCLALLIVAIAAYELRRHRLLHAVPGDGFVVLLLVGLPLVQALGTGNPVFALAIDAYAAWTAVFVLLATRIGDLLPRLVVHLSILSGVVVAGLTSGWGLVERPYRTEPLGSATTLVGGRGPLARLLVSPTEAGRLVAVRRALAGIATAGRPMMAFDELPGLIASLDGRSVGETWYSATDRTRSVANITDACAHGNPWGSRQPIIFYNRRPAADELTALRTCRIDLSHDYHPVPVGGFEPALTIYIPDPRQP